MTKNNSAAKGATLRHRIRCRAAPLALLPLAVLPFGASVAQDAQDAQDARTQEAAGLTASLTIGQRLDYENRVGESNAADEGFATLTDLGLAVHSTTRTQALRFSADGGLRYEINDNGRGDRFDLDDPRLSLSYSLQSRATRLSFDGSYRRIDNDAAAFDDDALSTDEASTGGGTRTDTRLGSRLELGREGPVGATLSYSLQTTRYANATDPSLVDLDTDSYAATLRLDVSAQLRLTVFADVTERDAAGPGSADRKSQQYGLGAAYQITPRTDATARLFYSDIDSDDNAGTTSSTEGAGVALGLRHALRNGSVRFDASQQETVNGAERALSVGRSLDFKRGSAGLTLGVSKTDGLEAEPLVGLTLGYEIDRLSRIDIDLTQSASVDDDNDATINSRLSLAYARALSDISRLQASLSLVERNVQTAAGQDQRATRLSLTHQYALGRDIGLVSGYSYSETKRDGQADTEQSRVFVGLEKTFNWRP